MQVKLNVKQLIKKTPLKDFGQSSTNDVIRVKNSTVPLLFMSILVSLIV